MTDATGWSAAASARLAATSRSMLAPTHSTAAGRACVLAADAPSGSQLCCVHSLAIALEPEFRRTHCSFCAAAPSDDEQIRLCAECALVGTCRACRRAGALDFHKLVECQHLARLSCHGCEAAETSSVVLLVARLMLCRRHAEASSHRRAVSSWSLDEFAMLDELVTNELAMDDESAEQMRATGEGLRALLGCGELDATRLPLHMLLAVTANAHVLVDLLRHIGEQSIGVALFPTIGAAFNHECAPSCHVVTSPMPRRRCVEASVRSLRPLAAGTPATISYIPLGGVPSACRARHLRQQYAFSCGCRECVDPSRGGMDLIMMAARLPDGDEEPAAVADVQRAAHSQLVAADGASCPLAASLVRASTRAVATHQLGAGHGYSMEAHRLEAWLAKNEGRHVESADASRAWLAAAEQLTGPHGGSLADPLAVLHQRLELVQALGSAGVVDAATSMRATAAVDAERWLGREHPYARRIRAQL